MENETTEKEIMPSPQDVEEVLADVSAVSESKSDKFHRLAGAKTQKVVDDLYALEKFASNSYEYTDEEVEKMFTTIQSVADNAKHTLMDKISDKPKFTF